MSCRRRRHLERRGHIRGNVVEGFVSTDGTTWSASGSLSTDLGFEISAGLAVTSHDAPTEAEAEFDDVSLTPSCAGARAWISRCG